MIWEVLFLDIELLLPQIHVFGVLHGEILVDLHGKHGKEDDEEEGDKDYPISEGI